MLCLGLHGLWARTPDSSNAEPADTVVADTTVQRHTAGEWELLYAEDSLYLMDDGKAAADIARKTDSLTLTLPKIKLEPYTPNPIRSMWLAMVCPGAGQVYNRKFWKLPIFYGGFLGCVYAFSWNSQMLRDYQQAYLDIMDSDPNTKSYEKMLPLGYDITGKEERFKDIFKRKKNYFRKYRDMSIFAFAGVYLLSIIDAYVDAELSTFDISRDLSLHWQPASLSADTPLAQRFGYRSLGVQCALAF